LEENGQITLEQAKELFNAELPDDLPEVISCRFCGEDKQLIQPNKRVAFWVHLDLDVFEECNILTFRTSFVKNLAKMWFSWFEKKKFHDEEEEEK
jgi:hypothetical protein